MHEEFLGFFNPPILTVIADINYKKWRSNRFAG